MGPLGITLNLKLIFVIVCSCVQLLVADCPRLCECKWKSGKESVICASANLSSVPLELDAGTQLLDLTLNHLITIKTDEFSKAGLLNLQKIYLSKCQLKNLDRYAFRNLINLVELDLSYNMLTLVPSHVLNSIPELRELKLSGNPIQRIVNDAFIHVPQLVKLELSDCKIGTIEIKAFRGLEKSLEWLNLDRNKLSEVKSSSFTVLQSLHELDLATNPWNCSCRLRPLREWMLRQNVPFGVPPVCRFPNRLISKSWDKLELDEFACAPEIIALDPKAHGIEGANVTLSCQTEGIPEPRVRWLLKNKVIANLSGTSYSNERKFYVVRLENNSTDLTILAANIQDAGVYICAAENKAGKSEASVVLGVSRMPQENSTVKKNLIASVVAGFFVLIFCSLALCVCTIRKRQMLKWRNRNYCRQEGHYEKIELNNKSASSIGGKNDCMESELSTVRKNGDYCLVPIETEQEEEGATGVSSIHHNDVKNWNVESSNEKWNSTELPLLDTEDLHIPRRTFRERRDDRRKNSHSMSGIYNQNQDYRITSNTPQVRGHLENTTLGFNYGSESSTSTCGVDEQREKNYPDLIEASPSLNVDSLKAISEGNSVLDLYCTLPHKKVKDKNTWNYSSTDSQFPLLAGSKYGSCERDNNEHQTYNNNPSTMSQRSNSYLNLSSSNKQHSSTMSGSQLNATPLLDINGLDSRMSYRRNIVLPSASSLSTIIVNSYDYHASQLERFLEEYRTLQKELSRMKESCDNLTRDKNNPNVLNSQSRSPTLENASMPNSPNSNQTLDISLRNFGSELSKYLLTKDSSPKTINNSGVFNNNN